MKIFQINRIYKRYKGLNKKTKIVLIVVVVLVFVFFSYKVFIKEEKDSFILEEVERGTVLQEVSETGVVKISERVNLGFKNSGRIEKIYVKEGDNVKKEEVLVELDKTELVLQLNETRSNLQVILAEKTNVEVSLESARQNLEDVKAEAEEDLNSAYEDALNVLEDAHLKIYNAYNDVYNLKKDYFPSVTNDYAATVADEENKMKDNLDKSEDYITDLENDSSRDNIDLTLSGMKKIAEKVRDSLKAIRDAVESTTYRDIVSDTYKSYLDTHKSNLNTGISNILDSQQAISTTKVENRTAINTAQSQVSELEDQLGGTQESLYQAKIKQARAQVSLLENQIQESVLKSPAVGKITEINKREGEIVKSGELVLSFLPSAPFQVEVDIYEEDIVKVKERDPVEITLVAFPGQTFQGEVISINPAEKLIEGVVYYEVTIDLKEEIVGIKPGMTADIVIKTGKKENVLVVSKRAVKKINGEMIVEVFKDGQIEDREIEIGLKGDDFYEVVSGLQEGEEIVIGKK